MCCLANMSSVMHTQQHPECTLHSRRAKKERTRASCRRCQNGTFSDGGPAQKGQWFFRKRTGVAQNGGCRRCHFGTCWKAARKGLIFAPSVPQQQDLFSGGPLFSGVSLKDPCKTLPEQLHPPTSACIELTEKHSECSKAGSQGLNFGLFRECP
jgi:hypothetical protein